jgi:predicted transposase/invertase (TIGR01784 family)
MQTIAEKWVKKGREQGIEQGREQGIEQGMEKGMEKFVENSLKEGLPIETIKRITGFPEEKINRMKKKMDLKREVRPS